METKSWTKTLDKDGRGEAIQLSATYDFWPPARNISDSRHRIDFDETLQRGCADTAKGRVILELASTSSATNPFSNANRTTTTYFSKIYTYSYSSRWLTCRYQWSCLSRRTCYIPAKCVNLCGKNYICHSYQSALLCTAIIFVCLRCDSFRNVW